MGEEIGTDPVGTDDGKEVVVIGGNEGLTDAI